MIRKQSHTPILKSAYKTGATSEATCVQNGNSQQTQLNIIEVKTVPLNDFLPTVTANCKNPRSFHDNFKRTTESTQQRTNEATKKLISFMN